jgi:hypothetical protein
MERYCASCRPKTDRTTLAGRIADSSGIVASRKMRGASMLRCGNDASNDPRGSAAEGKTCPFGRVRRSPRFAVSRSNPYQKLLNGIRLDDTGS